MKHYQAKLAAPFGILGIMTEGDAVSGIDFLSKGAKAQAPANPVAREACRQLQAYIDDPSFVFSLPLHLEGTPHRMKVWQALRSISWGETMSYGDLAEQLHSSPRAVGQACGANPIPVIIPCHRVLSKLGVGGFMHSREGGPLSIKRWLLDHESAKSANH
jgi:methylated-DNA-[protein]-cysteine S-methyltransferase